MVSVQDLAVIDDVGEALAALDPVRAKILNELSSPGSATSVAKALGLTRQKVNYHLRTLEERGLVQLVEERPRRGLTERVVVASARSYVMSSVVLGVNACDKQAVSRLSANRLSSTYLVALGARIVREVAALARSAEEANKPLATLAIDTEIRFASAKDRAAFTTELAEAVTTLAAKYHQEQAPRGRWHRLVVAAHPFHKQEA